MLENEAPSGELTVQATIQSCRAQPTVLSESVNRHISLCTYWTVYIRVYTYKCIHVSAIGLHGNILTGRYTSRCTSEKVMIDSERGSLIQRKVDEPALDRQVVVIIVDTDTRGIVLTSRLAVGHGSYQTPCCSVGCVQIDSNAPRHVAPTCNRHHALDV